MSQPGRDLVDYTPPPTGGLSLAALRAAGRLLRPDRPAPRALPPGLLWFEPTPQPWLVMRETLRRLAGQPYVLLGAERTLGAPGAPDPAALCATGARLVLSTAGLSGLGGAAAARFARRLLAAPGVHAIASLAASPEQADAEWALVDPAALHLDETAFGRLTHGGWQHLESADPVCSTPPRRGWLARLAGAGAAE